jgi:hypothetical protein
MNSKYLAFFGIVVLVMVGLAWVVGAGAWSNKGVWDFFQTENKVSGNIIQENVDLSVDQNNNEIISKRTYNSKTFQNSNGQFQTEIYSRDMFFYDGEQFVELDKFSNPLVEKKIIEVRILYALIFFFL